MNLSRSDLWALYLLCRDEVRACGENSHSGWREQCAELQARIEAEYERAIIPTESPSTEPPR